MIDTSSFLDGRGRHLGSEGLEAQAVTTHRLKGETVHVVPIESRKGDNRCEGCIGYNGGGNAHRRVSCMTLPDCTDVVYVEATEENLPLYIAWRLSRGA